MNKLRTVAFAALLFVAQIALAHLKLSNLSSRTQLITGFGQLNVGVTTDRPTNLLIRVAGPSLAKFGVQDYNSDPNFRVYMMTDGKAVQIASNDDWTPEANTQFAKVGAFPFVSSKEAADIVQLPAAGSYTVVVGSPTMSGIVLFEAYDIDMQTLGGMTNASIRGHVSPGEGALIMGVTFRNVIGFLNGNTVLVRAAGPSLKQFGITDALQTSSLSVDDAGGLIKEHYTNSGWQPGFSNFYFANTWGAFPFLDGAKDSALLFGDGYGAAGDYAYTAMVTGNDPDPQKNSGTALVELYWKLRL